VPSRQLQAYLSDPKLKHQWQKIKSIPFPIRISGYDITNECNLRCEGCFFFEGELSSHYNAAKTLDEYRIFFAIEKKRGITYPHFAGAEPALVQDRLRVAAEHWQHGLIYSNGTVKLGDELPFKIHISVWGGEEVDKRLRGGKVLDRAVRNYRGDKRAVFIYTVNPHNICDIPVVVQKMADNGLSISFNHYSASRQYKNKIRAGAATDGVKSTFRLSDHHFNLLFTPDTLAAAQDTITHVREDYPNTVIFSEAYNRFVHRPGSLFELDPQTGRATNCAILSLPYHRQYHTDFSHSDDECCIANVDCSQCRHYVSIYTLLMSKVKNSTQDLTSFQEWLDVYYTWCRLHFVDWSTSTTFNNAET